MASDNIMASIGTGVAKAGQDILGRFLDLEFRKKFKQQDLMDEMAQYREKLPLEEASQIRVARAKPVTPTYLLDSEGRVTGEVGGKVSRTPTTKGARKIITSQQAQQLRDAGVDVNDTEYVIQPGTAGKFKSSSQVKSAAESTLRQLKDYESKVTGLLNNPDLDSALGFTGPILSKIGGTKRADVAADIESLKAQTSLDKLQELRRNSPTGGALGNVSDAEGRRLENAQAALETKQTPENFRKNLKILLDNSRAAQTEVMKGYESDFGESFTPTIAVPQSDGGFTPDKQSRLEELRAKKAAGTLR